MLVDVLAALAVAGGVTAVGLEASIRRSLRRAQLRNTNQQLEQDAQQAADGHNAELYSLAAYRSVHRPGNGRQESDQPHECEVIVVDFRRPSLPERLRAQA